MTKKPQPTIGIKFRQHMNLCANIGELLTEAKKAVYAGEEPDPSIAPEINALFAQAKSLALEIGNALLSGERLVPRLAKHNAILATLVEAYIAYAKHPDEETYDNIIEALVSPQSITGKIMKFQ